MRLLIGGYTKKTATGIYELPLETKDSAKVGQAKEIIKIGGPTYFVQDHDLIFTINNAGDKGGISAYKLVNGAYQETDSYLTAGSSPAYIGINKQQKRLYTANYHTAVLAVFSYTADGKLTLLDSVTHTADTLGPRPEQVDGPHPHFFNETPNGNLVSCDLGNDCVDFYALSNNKLKHLASYQNEPGFGSRHITFSPDGNYFYVAGELSSKVNVVKFDENNWTFENIATYSTIPEDYTEHNGAAAIRMSSDGKYVYVSNRGHNSITVFGVKSDHTLQLAQRVSTFGEFPRDFNWDKNEEYVVVANQNTDNATLYTRDADNGCLTPIQKDIAVPEGTCVLFE
ncbi:lactonase family protein [Lactobacillus sp. ESL0731]|uniref:lactonase family protein n=1 Tax=unclassified Lactobacillus TaxID=2620435 RepID=UPI0023F6D564|nr:MULTISPECIES: lactonase family protein [unclassified Lactobacillus]WEV51729.1 lactonase family protein [Lactobacillus sp. ESL0700]WEV62858.1 lactonase family protein [Lactobacillus sp. ESL0731]